jgi:hypothetical protein
MLDNLEFDDSDSPAIGLVPPGVSWAQVRDHIKIAHHSLLVPPPAGGGDFAGAYWTGTDFLFWPNGPWRVPAQRKSRPPRHGAGGGNGLKVTSAARSPGRS